MNRLISVGELRALAIKHLVELSVEHEFFATFFLRENPVMQNVKNADVDSANMIKKDLLLTLKENS